MTKAELKDHFIVIAKIMGIPDNVADSFAFRAVEYGLTDFWNAHAWYFRSKETTLDTNSDESETYDLPGDFGGMGMVRHKDTTPGSEIFFKTKEDFDQNFPYPTSNAGSYPSFFTYYKEDTDGKWKIKFFPVPAIDTIYYQYFTNKVDETKIDGVFISGVYAAIPKYLYMPGQLERLNVIREYNEELQRLRSLNNLYEAKQTKILDGTETAVAPWRPWI